MMTIEEKYKLGFSWIVLSSLIFRFFAEYFAILASHVIQV